MHEYPPELDYSEALADQQEREQPPSIVEHYGDQIITVFGITGKLKDLIDGCPVPADQRSPADNERFAANALGSNGVVVDEKFAHWLSPKSKTEDEAKPKLQEKPDKSEPLLPKTLPPPVKAQPVAQQNEKPRVALDDALNVARRAAELLEQEQTVKAKQVVSKVELSKTKPKDAKLPKIVERTIQAIDEPSPVLISTKNVIELESQEEQPVVEKQWPAEAVEQLGKLYQEAAAEVAAEQITDEMLAELLETEVMDNEFFGQELVLPTVAEEGELNMLSIDETQIEHVEQTEQPVPLKLVQILPAEVAVAFDVAIETFEPEAAAELTELVQTMTLVAERLQVLVTTERQDSPEAIQIEQVLEEYYDQLCELIGIVVDADERLKFIAAIKSDVFQKTVSEAFELPEDAGTHEFKLGMLGQAYQMPVVLQQALKLARFIMNLGVHPV